MSELFCSRSEKGSTIKGKNLLLLSLRSEFIPFTIASFLKGCCYTGTQTEKVTKFYLFRKPIIEDTQENLVKNAPSVLSSLYRSYDHSLSFSLN